MNEIKMKNEQNTKNNSLNFETIKKIIFLFNPKEDQKFIDLIFQEKDTLSFFKDLLNYYKTIPKFSNDNIENKFYGIQNITKLQNTKQEMTTIELNKLNTDLIFNIVKQIMLSSYDNDISINNNDLYLDKKNLIKSRLYKYLIAQI